MSSSSRQTSSTTQDCVHHRWGVNDRGRVNRKRPSPKRNNGRELNSGALLMDIKVSVWWPNEAADIHSRRMGNVEEHRGAGEESELEEVLFSPMGSNDRRM